MQIKNTDPLQIQLWEAARILEDFAGITDADEIARNTAPLQILNWRILLALRATLARIEAIAIETEGMVRAVAPPASVTDFTTLPFGGQPPSYGQYQALDENWIWTIKSGEDQWQFTSRLS